MNWSMEKYATALDFAAAAHGPQKAPGKPYSFVVHLAVVCMEVVPALDKPVVKDPDLAVQCALLHDVLEDTEKGRDEIEALFGPGVADGVAALTERKDLPNEARLRDSLDRILAQPPEVGMARLADRIVSMQEPPLHWSKQEILQYKNDSEMIASALKKCSPLLAGKLSEKIREYEKYV